MAEISYIQLCSFTICSCLHFSNSTSKLCFIQVPPVSAMLALATCLLSRSVWPGCGIWRILNKCWVLIEWDCVYGSHYKIVDDHHQIKIKQTWWWGIRLRIEHPSQWQGLKPTLDIFYYLEADLLSHLQRVSCRSLGYIVDTKCMKDGWMRSQRISEQVVQDCCSHRDWFLLLGGHEEAAVAEFSCGFVPYPEFQELLGWQKGFLLWQGWSGSGKTICKPGLQPHSSHTLSLT